MQTRCLLPEAGDTHYVLRCVLTEIDENALNLGGQPIGKLFLTFGVSLGLRID